MHIQEGKARVDSKKNRGEKKQKRKSQALHLAKDVNTISATLC